MVLETPLEMWIKYAEEYLGITNYVSDKILVNYNSWFASEQYRKELLYEITPEWKFTDDGINDVFDYGYGSTFDMRNFDGKGHEMKVLDRWEHLIGLDDVKQSFVNIVRKHPTFLDNVKKIFTSLDVDGIYNSIIGK